MIVNNHILNQEIRKTSLLVYLFFIRGFYMKKILICIGLALTLSACGSDHIIRFNLSQQQNVNTTPSYEGRSHFFFWGMWQERNYNLMNVCPVRGINSVETHWTFYDSLMGGLTMGIYAPESYAVYCN